MNNYKSKLAGWGIEIDYVVGHSLGGAAATVYQQQHSPGGQTITFGAPKTRVSSGSGSGSCSVSGTRVAHESDSISSNVMGIMGGFNHDISGSMTRAYTASGGCKSCESHHIVYCI